ncbi:hypothetical protein ACMDCR_09925 [Labrys okinawensis]|uniref:hypothetical protein n=1 Tax=Labrys okinawensis TaxID=346911 RepID=UPI0039BCFCBD
MIAVPSPLQVDLLEAVSIAFAAYAWDRSDLTRLTASSGSGLVSPAQDLLLAAQILANLDFGVVAIPHRLLGARPGDE